jgi:cobyrinic acid a,c-diamide synthase
MFLARHITWQGRSAKMAGVLPCDVEIADRPQGHGYVLAEARRPHWFLDAGVQARGHEFHNSRLVDVDPELPTAYRLILGCGFGNGSDGLVYRNVLAGYTHLHAAGCPEWAPGLVARARGRDST